MPIAESGIHKEKSILTLGPKGKGGGRRCAHSACIRRGITSAMAGSRYSGLSVSTQYSSVRSASCTRSGRACGFSVVGFRLSQDLI